MTVTDGGSSSARLAKTEVVRADQGFTVAEAIASDRSAWDGFLAALPSGDPLQAWGWGEAVTAGGRERPLRLLVRDRQGELRGVGQVLVRDAALGRRVLYLPHGPAWHPTAPDADLVLSAMIDGLRSFGRRERGIVAKLDLRATPSLAAEGLALVLRRHGLRQARFDLQARTTRILDLSGGADALFASFEKDTRNAVRRSAKEGVTTRVVRDATPGDYEAFAGLLKAMGARAGVRIRPPEFLHRLAQEFSSTGDAYLVLADYRDQAIAGCLALTTGRRAFYLYAGSLREPSLRHTFGPYAALWRLCQALVDDGRTSLDLWGVSEPGDPETDPRWEGYSLFKRGFGGAPHRHAGVFDLVLSPIWYGLRDWHEQIASRSSAPARS